MLVVASFTFGFLVLGLFQANPEQDRKTHVRDPVAIITRDPVTNPWPQLMSALDDRKYGEMLGTSFDSLTFFI